MAEKLMTDGSMALREKQYRVITIEATEKPQNAKLRVAAYAPVSAPPLMTSSTPLPPRTVTTAI